MKSLFKLCFVLVVIYFPCSQVVAKEPLKIVASFTVLADVIQQVGGNKVQVSSLVPMNGDPHEYEPSAADSRRLHEADAVFISGEGLESWFFRIAQAANASNVIVASEGISTRTLSDENGSVQIDPHIWNDLNNVKIWVDNIQEALVKIDPDNAQYFILNAKLYRNVLDGLDLYTVARLAPIPKDQRKVVTAHDAFSYLGKAYDIEFLAPQGVSTTDEASVTDVTKLIEQIKNDHIHTYFIENSSNKRLVEQIAQSTGAQPGGELFPEALSLEVPNYVAMFKHNIDLIADALSF